MLNLVKFVGKSTLNVTVYFKITTKDDKVKKPASDLRTVQLLSEMVVEEKSPGYAKYMFLMNLLIGLSAKGYLFLSGQRSKTKRQTED